MTTTPPQDPSTSTAPFAPPSAAGSGVLSGPGGPVGHGATDEFGHVPAAVRPQSVSVAFWLFVGGLAIAVLRGIVGLVDGSLDRALDAEILKAGALHPLDPSAVASVRSVAQATLVAGVMIGIVFAFVGVGFVVMMRAGRNWARIVLTVVGAFSVLSLVSSLSTLAAQPWLMTDALLALVAEACCAAGVVLMYVRSANQYFAAVKAARVGGGGL